MISYTVRYVNKCSCMYMYIESFVKSAKCTNYIQVVIIHSYCQQYLLLPPKIMWNIRKFNK